jgi:ABC-2 type transport system permease protein
MKRLIALTWKELIQLKRDPISMRLIVAMPVMQVLIFGYAINYDVKHLKTVVMDESRSYESRELVAKMEASDYFDIVGRVDSFKELQGSIDSARASVGLVIDGEFGKDRHRGEPAEALLIVNASDSTTSNQAMSVMSGIANRMSVRVLGREAGWNAAAPPVDVRVRPWYNPELKTANFIIPGLIIIVLTFTLINFTANSIVKERELGTLEQLQVTPITGAQLIVGKILPFVLIGYVQLTLLVVMMEWLFNVRTAGSMVALYLLVGLYIAAVLGLGILMSTIAQTQNQATQLSLMTLLPFVFLSGYIVPIDGMPAIFQWLTTLVPAKYAIEIVRGLVLRGASAAELWEPIARLSLYTFVIVGMAIVRFKKTAA